MSDLTTELHEELDAFDPKWKEHYPSVGAAALAADATELFARWVKTDDGKKYLGAITGLPDHVGNSRREAEAMNKPGSLPFGYSNIGLVPLAGEPYSGAEQGYFVPLRVFTDRPVSGNKRP